MMEINIRNNDFCRINLIDKKSINKQTFYVEVTEEGNFNIYPCSAEIKIIGKFAEEERKEKREKRLKEKFNRLMEIMK